MNIREAIKCLADNGDEIYLKIGKVTAIDTDRRTCDVAPLDGSTPLPDVKLQAGESGANALIAWPRLESYVLVGFLTPDAGCVLLTHDPERIQATVGDNTLDLDADSIQATAGDSTLILKTDGITINGGKLGGLVNIDDLKANLENIKTHVSNLQSAIASGFSAVGIDQGASASAYNLAIAGKTITIKPMEDTKVKH